MAVWSEVKTSKVIFSKRIDAERYKPQYVNNEAMLSKIKSKPLKLFISDITGGATPLGANYPSSGIPFMRVQNIRENYWNLSDFVYISESVHNNQLHRSQLKNQDVLLTITGMSYGNSCVAWQEILPANMNQHSVRISLNKNLLPGFLSTFFISKFGRFQSDSKVTGDTRPALTYSEIDKYLIPEIDVCYQNEVHNIVRESFEKQMQSQFLYTQAQQLLEQELGLDKLTFEKPVGYEAQFSEAAVSARFDSEHYFPEFNSFINNLPKRIKLVPLAQLLNFCQRGKQPIYSKSGARVINSKHILNNKIVTEGNRYAKLNPVAQFNISHGDTLINGTGRGTIGRSAAYLETELAVPDNHVTILRTNVLDPVYLANFLNSKAGQLQVEKHQRGSSGQLELYPFDIRKFLVWDAPLQVQKEIRDLHEKAFSAEKQSKALLEQAKSRVESLIEEAAAK